MKENELRNKLSEAQRRQALSEKAAEQGIKAIRARADELSAKAEAMRQEAKLCENQDEAADRQGDAFIYDVEANATNEAAETYARAYQAIAGKPPKGAKDAKAIDRFAAELYERRTAARLTQTELAEIAGVTFATINRLERGRHEASAATKRKIKKALEKAERRKAAK